MCESLLCESVNHRTLWFLNQEAAEKANASRPRYYYRPTAEATTPPPPPRNILVRSELLGERIAGLPEPRLQHA